MTSSPEKDRKGAAKADDLPPALSSMWRLCKLGLRHEPALMSSAFLLSLLAALPDALLAWWLKLLGEGVLRDDARLVRIAAIALGVSAAATWLLRTVSTRVQRRFRDRVTIVLESHVARLQASVTTIAHQERPEYLDRLAMLRDQVFVLDHLYMSLFSTCGWILRLGVTVALLASIHPALVLLAVFALPTVLTSTWRPAVERSAHERGAQANRLARHLFTIATTASPGKEVRVTGIGERLVADRREAWERWYRPVAAARWGSAGWHTLAWAVFGSAYVGAVAFVAWGLRSSAGDVLLVLAAGARLSAYIGATVGEIGFLRGFWMDGSRRLAWLEDYAASLVAHADLSVPSKLHEGIRFDHVSFAYPGTERLVLEDVSLELPAASRSPSASGKSSRSRAASCATTRSSSSSTSRPPRSTRRPSTPSSSATPPPRAIPAKAAQPTDASRSSCPTASVRSAWPISSSCSTARVSSRSALTRISWRAAGSTPSCMGFRRRRTGEPRAERRSSSLL
ncbi:MAG TPA: ABC transporter ATP-binding protein [Thermoanaerobaculia bacterium]|nr:ABC transporter ATP-binding protein [Thermoanaerobaculia bacterium]